jgi:hypothetical protein
MTSALVAAGGLQGNRIRGQRGALLRLRFGSRRGLHGLVDVGSIGPADWIDHRGEIGRAGEEL